MNIKTLLSQKEGPMWDFKSARVEPKDLAKILIAFANTDGGTVVIGVEKDRSISGIKNYSNRINSLLQTSISFIEPPNKIKPAYVNCRNKEGKTDKILLLEVSPSGKVHNNNHFTGKKKHKSKRKKRTKINRKHINKYSD